jgi:hypothetical protein
MRKLIRNPLTWMVVAEIVVVSALIVLAWNAIAGGSPRPPTASSLVAVDPSVEDSPAPDLPVITKPESTAPQPGLNLDPTFWLTRLQALNKDQVVFEQHEWRVIHAATQAAQRYLETVVLPSVTAAEKGGRL